MIIPDESTNNFDILTAAIIDYDGTLLVISHEVYFLELVGVSKEIYLN